jgi:NTP pyrophosphatase (non-canonical NTP hydrolase)
MKRTNAYNKKPNINQNRTDFEKLFQGKYKDRSQVSDPKNLVTTTSILQTIYSYLENQSLKQTNNLTTNTYMSKLMMELEVFRNVRDWKQFHDPKNLANAISIEASELLEIFLWKKSEESYNLSQKETTCVKEEVADIFIFLIYFCIDLNIDLVKVSLKKIKKNAKKYPIEKSYGSRKKYNQLK